MATKPAADGKCYQGREFVVVHDNTCTLVCAETEEDAENGLLSWRPDAVIKRVEPAPPKLTGP